MFSEPHHELDRPLPFPNTLLTLLERQTCPMALTWLSDRIDSQSNCQSSFIDLSDCLNMYIGQNSRSLIGCTTMLMLDAGRGSATCPQRQPGEPSAGGCALQQPWADYTQIGLSDNLVGSSCIVNPVRRYAEFGMSDS
jgi:hypothetical protein